MKDNTNINDSAEYNDVPENGITKKNININE